MFVFKKTENAKGLSNFPSSPHRKIFGVCTETVTSQWYFRRCLTREVTLIVGFFTFSFYKNKTAICRIFPYKFQIRSKNTSKKKGKFYVNATNYVFLRNSCNLITAIRTNFLCFLAVASVMTHSTKHC